MRAISIALALSGFVMIWFAVHTLAATAHGGYYQRVVRDAIEHNMPGNERASHAIQLLVERNDYYFSHISDASVVLGIGGLANLFFSVVVLRLAPRRTEKQSS
jgi:hypothetical protein